MINRTNLWVDLAFLGGFLVIMEPPLTGLALHEWISLAVLATMVVHLLLHWRWTVSVTAQFFRNLFHSSRLQYIVDGLTFIVFTGAMFSGLMISRAVLPTLGLRVVPGFEWSGLHSLFAHLSLVLIGVHFALHWRWVVKTTRRYILSPIFGMFHRREKLSSLEVK